MKARLSIQVGEDTPTEFVLSPEKQPVTLGRHKDNTIVLRDEHASRWHARFRFQEGNWLVENVGTPLNGTKVAGLRITDPVFLEDNQVVEIGDVRLRFIVDSGDNEPPPPTAADSVTMPQKSAGGSGSHETPFLVDELSSLCQFMAGAVEDDEPRALIRRALETLLRQTRATLVGFLSLDPEQPLPKMVLPADSQVDAHLSRHLTRRVQEEKKVIWLGEAAEAPEPSDSLLPFTDAICLPLGLDDPPLGAVHVYRKDSRFSAREKRFCEVVTGHLNSSFQVLRSRLVLAAENQRLRRNAPEADELLGDSLALRQLRHLIERVAGRSAPVLIEGETGVGKELVARAVHRKSERRSGPLVTVNCAAIARDLADSLLFGHVKGSFTGALVDHLGYFRLADEGTIFLDELGELSLDCQAKLLRAIEGYGFQPVGSNTEVKSDIRVIAATNRNLEEAVRKGTFRQDLFYRLQMLRIAVPPLREHPEDIPTLAAHYLTLAAGGREQVRLTEAAIHKLQGYSWPGNVRQLWAALESAIALGAGSTIDAADLHLPLDTGLGVPPSLELEELEKWAIQQALRRTEGNITHTAKLLGIARDTLHSKLKRYKIDKEGE